MGVIFSYGTLQLNSGEIKKARFNKKITISSMETLAFTEITESGSLSATRFTLEATVDKNATGRFTEWLVMIARRPTENLTVFARNWGNFLIENVDITATDIAPDGDILAFDLFCSFTQYINF